MPSSCTRQESLLSSENKPWCCHALNTREALVRVQERGSFQNPGWTAGWNSGREQKWVCVWLEEGTPWPSPYFYPPAFPPHIDCVCSGFTASSVTWALGEKHLRSNFS